MTAICITGMHRSGTSLIASVLQESGVFIGANLMKSGVGNPRGHFEDLEFVSFHERLLKRSNKTFLVQDLTGLNLFTPEDIELANSLISNRSHQSVWGWKDPRSTLFLNFWDERVPQAFYIFLYRHPVTVSHSLLRRGAVYPENDALMTINAWNIYNQEILNFVKKKPEKCLLGNVHGITQDFSKFISRVNAKFGLTLDPNIDSSIFHSDELARESYNPAITEAFKELIPNSFRLWNQLESIADISSSFQEDQTSLDTNYTKSIRTVINKQLAPFHNTDLKLNYLFYFLDPTLANNKAKEANSFLQRIQSLGDRELTIDSLMTQLNEREQIIDSLTAENLYYELSKSWRITRPLRKITQFLRGKKNV